MQRKSPNTVPPTPATSMALTDMADPEFFKALGDPTRLALVCCMARACRPCSVSEIAECCSVDLSVVSRHLALLERTGILEGRREGRTMFYTLRRRHLVTHLRSLARAIESCAHDRNHKHDMNDARPYTDDAPIPCCEPGCCTPPTRRTN